MDFVEFETALDERRLWIKEHQNGNPKYYLVRRNGRTKLWRKVENEHRWEIPIKWKLNNTARISEKFDLDAWFKAQPGPSELVGADLLKDEQSLTYFERYIAGDR